MAKIVVIITQPGLKLVNILNKTRLRLSTNSLGRLSTNSLRRLRLPRNTLGSKSTKPCLIGKVFRSVY